MVVGPMTATTEVDPRLLDALFEAEVERDQWQDASGAATRAADRDGAPLDEVVDPEQLERMRVDLARVVAEAVDMWHRSGRPDELSERIQALPEWEKWLVESNRDPETEAVFDESAPKLRHSDALIDWQTFWSTDHAATDYLIAPVLARGRLHSLVASTKTQKSLLSLSMSARPCTGANAFGTGAVEPIRVLCMDQEMTAADLQERLLDMGFDERDDLSNLAYYQLAQLAPLDTPAGAGELHDLVDSAGARQPQQSNRPGSVVVSCHHDEEYDGPVARRACGRHRGVGPCRRQEHQRDDQGRAP